MCSNDGQIHAPGYSFKQRSLSTEIAMGEREKSFVRKRWSYERNSKWQTVRTKSRRSRDSREDHQVHKIRVIAEIRVHLDRVCGHLLVGVNGSSGGQDQNVHRAPLAEGGAAQIQQAILGLER